MRLPWPFGRSASGDGASSGSTGDAAGAAVDVPPASASASAPAPASIPATGAWRTLPPIQRTSGPPPVVAPASTFLAEVPGHLPLPPIVTPLGHDAGPGGPPGVVAAIATVAAHPHPVPSLTSSAPLPPGRPVQRQADAGRSAVSPAMGAGGDGQADDDAAVAAAVAAPLPEVPPVRTVAPVSPAATVTPPLRPLTRAASTLTPVPVTVARSASSAASSSTPAAGSSARPPAAIAAPLQATSRLPRAIGASPASASASSSTSASEDRPLAPAGPPRRFTELPAATPAPAVQREATAHRRAGLGAPLPSAPASAVVQRASSSSPARAPLPEPSSSAADAVAATGHGAAHTPAVARPLPTLPVARRRAEGDPAAATSGAPAGAGDAAGTGNPSGPARSGRQRAAAATPVVARQAASVVPTVGARPLLTSVTSPSMPAPDDGSGGSVEPQPAAVPARWGADDALPATVTALAPTAGADRGIPVQLSRAAAPPATSSAPATAPAMREIVFPPRDDADGDGDGGSGPGAFAAVGPPAHAATAAIAGHPAPAVQRSATQSATRLSLARPVAPAPTPAATPAPAAAAGTVVARIVADPSTPGTPATVQTSPSGGIPVGTFTATPVVQREEAAPPPQAPTPGTGRSDRELDELAKALFGRIRTQLKSEVIHEREAKGLGFDAF